MQAEKLSHMFGYSSMRQVGNSQKNRVQDEKAGSPSIPLCPKHWRDSPKQQAGGKASGIQYDQHPEDGSPTDSYPTTPVSEKIRPEGSYSAEKKHPECHFLVFEPNFREQNWTHSNGSQETSGPGLRRQDDICIQSSCCQVLGVLS